MSWYKQLKAMPLPSGATYTDDDLEKLDPNRFTYPTNVTDEGKGDAQYLNSGYYGYVFQHPEDPSKVVKITRDYSEEFVALKILKLQERNGGFLPCVMGVYSVEQISEQPAYRLILEKVEPLSAGEADQAHIYADTVDEFSYYLKKMYPEQIENEMKRIMSNRGRYNQEYDYFLKEYSNFIKELSDYDIDVFDTHGFNLGRRDDGSLVLLDLGMGIGK